MSAFQSQFRFQGSPALVQFAPGARSRAGETLDRIGGTRALVLSTPQQADQAEAVAASLGGKAAGVFTGAAMHTPVHVTKDALERVRETGADSVVSIGGGSTIGLGKAIAYNIDLPQLVIPTTYAGSEATPILGQTEDGVKTTLTSPRVLPEAILYDAELVASLPAKMSATSGLNAMAHAVEALYARDRNPISTLLALEGIRAFAGALPQAIAAPDDLEARGETLYGAWLCGTVLGQVGMALHHKLCHTLGGSFDLPHAETHAIVLAHATAYNEAAVPDLLRPVAEILGAPSAAAGISRFARRIGAPTALAEIGFGESDIGHAAELAVSKPYWNPRPVTRAEIEALLRNAWQGADAQAGS